MAKRPADLVDRAFAAATPDRLWVADLVSLVDGDTVDGDPVLIDFVAACCDVSGVLVGRSEIDRLRFSTTDESSSISDLDRRNGLTGVAVTSITFVERARGLDHRGDITFQQAISRLPDDVDLLPPFSPWAEHDLSLVAFEEPSGWRLRVNGFHEGNSWARKWDGIHAASRAMTDGYSWCMSREDTGTGCVIVH